MLPKPTIEIYNGTGITNELNPDTSYQRYATPGEKWLIPEFMPITRLEVTNNVNFRYEYIKPNMEHNHGHLTKYVRYDDTVVSLNPKYIVSAEDFILAIARLSVPHAEKDTNILTYYRLLRQNQKLVLINAKEQTREEYNPCN